MGSAKELSGRCADGIRRRSRSGALVSGLVLIMLAWPQSLRAEEGRFGALSIWDLSGITGGSESYENQLAIIVEPSLALGTLWAGAPRWLRPLNLSAELQVAFELAGNDGRFRGSEYSGPARTPGGAEALAVNEVGAVTGAATGQADGTRRRALLSDLWLGLGHPEVLTIPVVDLDLGARLSALFPTSAPSQNTGLLATLSGGLSLSRTLFDRLDLRYGLRFSYYFYRYKTNSWKTLEDEIIVNGRPEPLYQPNQGTILNPEMAVVNEFSVDVRLWGELSVQAAYSLINSFTYALSDEAEAGHPLADLCGDGQDAASASGGSVTPCGERARRDSHWFRLYLDYPVLSFFTISLGLSTMQPVRHEGGGISNPFVQTVPTANFTTVELGLRFDLELTAAALGLGHPTAKAPKEKVP